MPFPKYAYANVVTPHVSQRAWSSIKRQDMFLDRVKVASVNPENLIDKATEIFGEAFDPKNYLLTHATIVGSVDTEPVPSIKTGSLFEDGFKVNRKWDDYYVASDTIQLINNNCDCFERDVLLKAYPTFIGGHSFVEHVQVEDLSKGRIIDAVARDVGQSVYIDILIANDRKHTDLIASIESGKLSTLSMGCVTDLTICTKCGHVAADTSELCPHIKYEKGNVFYDANGKVRKIAELCGHKSIDNGGVTFVEASWVEVPAFTGAVMRNIITPTEEILEKAKAILSKPPKSWDKTKTVRKSFDYRYAQDDFPSDFGGENPTEQSPEEKPREKDNLSVVEDELETYLLDKVKKRVKDKIQAEKVNKVLPESTAPSEGVVKESSTYIAGLQVMAKTAANKQQFIAKAALYNKAVGLTVDPQLYRCILKVGSIRKYSSANLFIRRCASMLGRNLTKTEAATLLRFGMLLSYIPKGE